MQVCHMGNCEKIMVSTKKSSKELRNCQLCQSSTAFGNTTVCFLWGPWPGAGKTVVKGLGFFLQPSYAGGRAWEVRVFQKSHCLIVAVGFSWHGVGVFAQSGSTAWNKPPVLMQISSNSLLQWLHQHLNLGLPCQSPQHSLHTLHHHQDLHQVQV